MRFKDDNGIAELYQYYKDTTDIPVDIKIYRKIINALGKQLVHNIMIKSSVIKAPYNVGRFGIVKKEMPKAVFKEDGNIDYIASGYALMVDWKATKELWEEDKESKLNKSLVYYDNEHSDGYTYKIKWQSGNVKNIKKYVFIPCRTFKRNVAAHIKSNSNIEYNDF